jgi:hypothetical protein
MTHFFLGNTLAEVGDCAVAIEHLQKASGDVQPARHPGGAGVRIAKTG